MTPLDDAGLVGLVDRIASTAADVTAGVAAEVAVSPAVSVLAVVLSFVLAFCGRAALRWWLALRDVPPEQRAEIIRALTRQPPRRRR